MKATFTTNEIGVTLSHDVEGDDGVSRRVERIFTCPVNGGYVLEYRIGNWRQVCDRLRRMGNTLSCSGRDQLLTMIRREYRAMRRAEKREASRR